MNITTKTVLRHFLERDLTARAEELDPFFMDFFIREELVEMLKWRYGMLLDNHLNIGTMDYAQMLDYLSDRDILSYFMELWDRDTVFRVSTNSKAIDGLLAQLGLRPHYLGHVPSDSWDGYDHSNHRSLLVKAGMLKVVYGIYDREVSQKEVEQVDSHPRRFYESHAKAEMVLREMADPKGLHILYRHLPV